MKFLTNPYYTKGSPASPVKPAATVKDFLQSVPDAETVGVPLVAMQCSVSESDAEAAAVALGCAITDDGLE